MNESHNDLITFLIKSKISPINKSLGQNNQWKNYIVVSVEGRICETITLKPTQLLLDIINNKNSFDETIIFIACRFGTLEIIEFLLSINSINLELESNGLSCASGCIQEYIENPSEYKILNLWKILNLLKSKGYDLDKKNSLTEKSPEDELKEIFGLTFSLNSFLSTDISKKWMDENNLIN